MEDGRERLLDHRLVLPVQVPWEINLTGIKSVLDFFLTKPIPCGQRAPSVSDHHPVGVQHGDDLEDHAVAEDPVQ